MTKITPYTALCELFRHKIDSNDLKKQPANIEQHGHVVSLENKRKKTITIHNSCQTQPLRDYSFDQVMGKQKIRKKFCTRDMHAINISLKDDNFQILQPDYAAYSGEKPNSESTPYRNKFNIMQMSKKPPSNNNPFFNNSLEHRNVTPVNSLKINNQTMTSLESTFQEKIVKPSNVNRFKIQNDFNRDRIMPDLNLYRQDTKDKYKYQIHSSCKDPKVHALYKTVSNLKRTFEDKYHHEEKCLCDHCGALAVVNESLKRPIIYDNYEEDEDDHQHYRRHRKKSKRSKHDDKEYMKLIIKLKMMEERINELEELNYIQGPIKIENSSLTFDMYTQCGKKKKKKTRFDTPECRSFSPKRFCNKGCPFPFTLPSTIKEKIFKHRSSEDTGNDDDSDYKVKHVSRNPCRENMPQPKLRCHEYMKKKQLENDAPPKKTFWKTVSKTYNVESVDTEDANIPTKDTNTINDKQIQELLLELSKKKMKTVSPEPKAVRFTLNPKATDTKILYERKQDNLSSKSYCLDSDMKLLSGETFKKNSTIPETISEGSDLFLLKAPDVIEQLVRAIPMEASHPNSINLSERSNYLRSRDLYQSSASSAKPSSIEQDKIKALVENITISKTTFSKSVCQYINSNYTNKTTTTNDTDSCATVRQTYKRSRSLSPDNTKTIENIVPKNDTKRKKLTLPNANYKRPQSLDRDGKPKNFIELNKNVSRYARKLSARPKRDYAAISRSPYRAPKNSPIQVYPGHIEEENVKKDLPRKKWNFPFLDTNPHETNFDQSNKEKIIRQLSKLSDSKSNSFEIDSSEIATTATISNDTSISKTCSKEVIKKKSSIFSVIKRYSKQFISKRKPKKNSSDNESNMLPCDNNKEGVKSKKTTNSNDKNVSKIPVYHSPDRSRNSSPERKDKYINAQIGSSAKEAAVNDKIFVFEGNKNNQNNFNKYTEVHNSPKVEPNFDLSINTLVINKTMSNIIVYNTNLPIISEQVTGKLKAKNLTMQNNVPHNCMPTFIWNDNPVSKVRILPAKEQQQVNYATVNKKKVKFTEAKQSTSKPSTNRSSDTKFPLQEHTTDNKCTKETDSCCKNSPLNLPRSSGVRSGLRNNKKPPKSAVNPKDIPTPKPSKVLQKDSCEARPSKKKGTGDVTGKCARTESNLDPGEKKKSSKPDKGKSDIKNSSIPVPVKQPQEKQADVKPVTSKCAQKSSCSKSSLKSSPQVQREDYNTKMVAPKKACSKCSIKSNESTVKDTTKNEAPIKTSSKYTDSTAKDKTKKKEPENSSSTCGQKCIEPTVKDTTKKEEPIRSPSKCGGVKCTDSTVKEKTKKKEPENTPSTCGMKCIEPTVKDIPKKDAPIRSPSKCGGIKCTDSTVKDKTKKKAPTISPSTCGMKCIDPIKEKTKKEPPIKVSSKCGGIKCSESAVKDKTKNKTPFSSSSTCGMKCVDPKLKSKTRIEPLIRCNSKCGTKCTESTVKDQARIETLHTSKCKCVGSTQDILDPEDVEKSTKCGTAKCSPSNSSLMILIDYGDQNQSVNEKNDPCQKPTILKNKNIPSCTYVSSSHSMLERRGVCKTNKLKKRSSSECNLICPSNDYTEQNLAENEDTCQEPCGFPSCTYVPSSHGMLMIGSGKVCKKNIAGQAGTGKCNSRCASCASHKSSKKLNKFKDHSSCQEPKDIPECSYKPSSHGILMIGSGKTCKKNIAGQTGTGKCNSRCASCASHRSLKNLNKCIDQELSVNQKKDSCQSCNDTPTIDKIEDTSVSSSHSITVLGRGSGKNNKRGSSKCSLSCASRSSLNKLNDCIDQNLPVNEKNNKSQKDIPSCTCVPSSHNMKKSEKRGKGKCKRCAPPPPIQKVKSKCDCSLSNLNISFETTPRNSKHKQCNKPILSNKRNKDSNCGCGPNELSFQPAFEKCNSERCASRVSGPFVRRKKSETKRTTCKRNKQNTPPKSSSHDLKGKKKCTNVKGSSANTSKSKSSTSKLSSSSKKSSRGSSCSRCPECKSTHSSCKRSTLTIKSSIKRICNLRKMKKKIASKFSCKYFRNLYKHPIFAGASRSKCREMRMRNFCDVSKRDFGNDCPNMTDPNCSCSLMYGSTGINRSVVNLYYNMQRFSFDPSPSEDLSYTDEDLHLTEEEKRSYLIEKLYLLQDFRDRIHDDRSSSNYGAFE